MSSAGGMRLVDAWDIDGKYGLTRVDAETPVMDGMEPLPGERGPLHPQGPLRR